MHRLSHGPHGHRTSLSRILILLGGDGVLQRMHTGIARTNYRSRCVIFEIATTNEKVLGPVFDSFMNSSR